MEIVCDAHAGGQAVLLVLLQRGNWVDTALRQDVLFMHSSMHVIAIMPFLLNCIQ